VSALSVSNTYKLANNWRAWKKLLKFELLSF
jgi:hypothetical protein